jgi:CheY-like chemotaxis protein
MKILIVEDNEVNLYMLKSLLLGNGYEVIESTNGNDALERLKAQDIDMIISDVLMPVMDGFALCRAVRKDESLQHIPFIIYTATYTGPQDEAFAREIGANRFIIKPCEPTVIIQAIEDLVEEFSQPNKIPKPQVRTEEEVLKLYNERLIRKLEQKMLQAEQDVKAKQDALEALHRSETLLNATQSISKIGGWEWDTETQEMYATLETLRIQDVATEGISAKGDKTIQDSIQCYAEEDRPVIAKMFQNCAVSGIPYEFEGHYTTNKGRQLYVRTTGKPVYQNGKITKVIGTIQDITEINKHELEQIELREQLRQSQKLDSIGQLAGGIAHDFNNILAVILGYSEEIMSTLPEESPIHNDITEIVKAGKRALSLTRQLLTFSRKHLVLPHVLNLNDVIQDLTKMLARLIYEDIELSTLLASELGLIKVDLHQLEQVIINLVINAREAMPHGGKLKLETHNIVIDSTPSEKYIGVEPGKYTVLSVMDTGCGMDKDTVHRIFEPFFTTKTSGKGTGLGLSMVYGIVKQSEGHIKVVSEPGRGTTFEVLFPQTDEKPENDMESIESDEIRGDGEHIVLVEDDCAMRILANKLLIELGYKVTMFGNAKDAASNIIDTGLKPDLVITDVVMPGMNGKQLADELHRAFPELPVLFMSGYTDSVILDHGVLDPGIPFIQKPFTKVDLALQIQHLMRKSNEAKIRNLQVLMIDDDVEILKLYKRAFHKKGHNVVCVANETEANLILGKQPMDVILVDMNIPGTDGLSVIREIRDSGYPTPVIAISGDINSIDMVTLKPLGVVSAFEKSFDIQSLIETVERMI